MNRLLLIPCVASCLGFVFLAGTSQVDNAGASYRAIASGAPTANGDAEAPVLMGSQQVQEGLMAKWELYNGQKRAFSRVYRPEDRYRKPGILVNETLTAPEGSFVGVFTIQTSRNMPGLAAQSAPEQPDADSMQVYPIVVDRRTGDAIVFSAGEWIEFSHWAVTGS